jgi:1-acyl-sn-glycerol-3-phosphate acyltransferase
MERLRPNVPTGSPLMWRWFSGYARRFVRKHFHAVRLLRGTEALTRTPDGEPLIVCSNHPSWWDPMIGIFLAQHLWPHRRHYWPIDAAMLAKYRFFTKLGFFGVDKDSARGAATFLRTAAAALAPDGPAGGNACLWVTAGADFQDVRARPVLFKPGVESLARRLDRGVILPLAVEYPFWSEKTPEALLAAGRPIPVSARPTTDALRDALTGAMDDLAAAAVSREPAQFTTLLSGAAGTTRVYDVWRRGKAFLAGKAFDPSHLPEQEARPA